MKGIDTVKLWIDDVRPAPEGYTWVKTVEGAIIEILTTDALRMVDENQEIELIDIDHDAGDYVQYGGDYIKLLDWLEETGRNYPIRIHSMNPVGRQNMLAICQKNGWKVIN